jgi:signal peptidase II
MTHLTKRRVLGLVIALAVFLADQAIKGLMTGPLRLQEVRHIGLLPIFDLTWTENTGVSLGLFSAASDEGRWFLLAMTGLIALVVTVWMLRERLMGDIVPLAMILGGALGNIRDRYLYGYVIDYADLHFGSFRPFLIFNLADAAITIGVVIILVRSLFMREKPSAPQSDHKADNSAEIS